MNEYGLNAVNIAQQKTMAELHALNRAKTEGITIHQQSLRTSQSQESKYREHNVVLQKALDEANDLVMEWQAAMEAWKDLAQVLRDEIKACPNHEAHEFGKNLPAVRARINANEDTARSNRNLPLKYTPEQKGFKSA
jgi:hypothetical protein